MNRIILIASCILFAAFSPRTLLANAEYLYVSARKGDDRNSGTASMPLKTIQEAATRLGLMNGRGTVTIRIDSGVYPTEGPVVLATQREFTEGERLVIEATMLPDDATWKYGRMPALFSVEDPRTAVDPDKSTETYCLKIDVDHVTIRGLRFLGSPLANNYHCAIERVGRNRDDLNVSQCVFVGDHSGLDMYCPVIGTGNRLVVEHCVFYGCHNAVVFWDGKESVGGRRHAVRNCIIAGCDISGIWTCQTKEDLIFENNIVADCKYAWMRKPGDRHTYSMRNCVVSNVEFLSGSGEAFGPFQVTPDSIVFIKERVSEEGQITLQTRKSSRDYLHVVRGTHGSDLKAGLFKNNTSQR